MAASSRTDSAEGTANLRCPAAASRAKAAWMASPHCSARLSSWSKRPRSSSRRGSRGAACLEPPRRLSSTGPSRLIRIGSACRYRVLAATNASTGAPGLLDRGSRLEDSRWPLALRTKSSPRQAISRTILQTMGLFCARPPMKASADCSMRVSSWRGSDEATMTKPSSKATPSAHASFLGRLSETGELATCWGPQKSSGDRTGSSRDRRPGDVPASRLTDRLLGVCWGEPLPLRARGPLRAWLAGLVPRTSWSGPDGLSM
mmetsp:Transcript_5633/g.7825  ORF Transcript_5633/g.7825 Transcript_5633/m.7825 type:complete len:260 (-) Transcript_5633:867-1646(-)